MSSYDKFNKCRDKLTKAIKSSVPRDIAETSFEVFQEIANEDYASKGDLKGLENRIDKLENKITNFLWVIGAAVPIIGIILAIFTFFSKK